MMDKTKGIENYDVAAWIQDVGWPSENADTIEMQQLYEKWWQLYPRCRITGIPNGDYLIEMITTRMRELHPESEVDATIIATLLIVKAAFMAYNDGIPPSTSMIH